MNNYRPKIKIDLLNFDYALEFFALMVLSFLWTLIILNFKDLPHTIPTHFNYKGQVDGYGSRIIIFMLPIASTIIYLVLSILNKFPNIFNYIVDITNQNAEIQYIISTRMLRFLKLNILLIFTFILVSILMYMNKNIQLLGFMFLPIVLILIFIPVIYYIFKSLKYK